MNDIIFSDHVKQYIMPILEQFMDQFVTYKILKITDPILSSSLNLIGGYQHMIISFDIEFQSAIVTNKKYAIEYTSLGDKRARFIGEFGGIILIKDINNDWYYLGNIMVNFQNIHNHGIKTNLIKFNHSKYSTVTPKTEQKMLEIEKHFDINLENLSKDYFFNTLLDKNIQQNILKLIGTNIADKDKNYINKKLGNIQFNLYPKYINSYYGKLVLAQQELYFNDPLVKSRMLTKKQEVIFLDMFKKLSKYTYFVVKGNGDFEAINNTAILLGVNTLEFNSVFDIEIFNKISQNLYGNAQLETTFTGVTKSKIYKKHIEDFFNNVLGDDHKAHNPVTDSIWTLIVALCFMGGISEYFGDSNNYVREYIKYKNKYLEIKNKNRL